MQLGNLAQRSLVALIGIPIVIYLVLMKPFALMVLVLILALLTVHEYYGLARAKGFRPQVGIGLAMTAFVVLAFAPIRLSRVVGSSPGMVDFLTTHMLPIVLILGVIATMTAELFKGYPNPFNHVAFTLSGAVYIGVGMGCFYGIHELLLSRAAQEVPGGPIDAGPFVITMLAAIWICDSAAYFGGKAMGKHLLFERVSPKKTWEGAIWGFIFSYITFFVARAVIPSLSGLSVGDCLVLGTIVGIMGQIGDLAESLLKRDAGVKDSSNLIPGHGGVLDRLDSILFVSPLVYTYLYLCSMF
jgi:phosphatidate cytidylyltransferase